MSSEDQKPGDHINLKVKEQNGSTVYFKVKKSTQLRKLMEAYCKRQGKDISQVRFLFDGERIHEDQTPGDLQMEDEDEIDVMVAQTGGNMNC
jgi:small ubiquitin-related modifier